jgi:hypothetical protein
MAQSALRVSQFFGVPEHCALAHRSPVVQALPSSHASVLFALRHPVAGTQESFVHALPSSQFSASEWLHSPPGRHLSMVQRFGIVLAAST